MRTVSKIIVILAIVSAAVVQTSFASSKLKLRSADVVSVTSPYTIAMKKVFIPKVKELSNGAITVIHYPAGQLGSDSAISEGVKLGTIDIGIIGTVGSPAAEAMYLPFLFKSAEHQDRFMESKAADTIKRRIFEDSGVKIVGFSYFAPRQLSSNKKIQSASDLKGLKIRVPLIPPMVATWRALGASPTPIAFTELFSALQQDIVKAQENPYEIILNNSFYEVQKYVMQTDHSIPVRFCVINYDLWKSLDKKQQRVIDTAWRATAKEIKRLYMENDEKYKAELKKKGMKLVSIDRQSMIEATKDVWKAYAPKAWGEGVYEEIQKLNE